MRVKNRMTTSPVTVPPKTNYNEAMHIMRENSVNHLPIMDAKRGLVGIVSRADMLEAEPSPVTTLSYFEMASLLEKLPMSEIMTKPVLAVEGECSISNAARIMLEHDIGCLPVMNGDELVCIITDTDIFRTFVEITGGGQAGTRLEVKMPDEKGQLVHLIREVTDAGSYIVSVIISYDESGPYGFAEIKERGGDEKRLRTGIESLENVEIVEFRPRDEDKVLSFG